jgi:spermidine/putrescine transport system substrate-binding protein
MSNDIGHIISRRQLLARGARLGLGVAAGGSLLAACSNGSGSASPSAATGSTGSTSSGSSTPPVTGTATFNNYPGWIGSNEFDDFAAQFPGASIKQKAVPTESIASDVLFFKQNPGAFDFGLEDQSAMGQMVAADVLQELNFDNIPNIANVSDSFRTSYSHGIPTDYGKVGVGFRKDIVTEGITSWADVWQLAPKYSGQITFLNLDRDCMGSALKYLGYSGNSTDPAELDKCKQALLEIKPHLQALTNTNVANGLVKGTVAISMDWDFDIALANKREPNVGWIVPEEGGVAYLEGLVAITGTDALPVVESFMNFHLDPKNYASFVNATGTAYVEDAATPYIEESISKNPILYPDPDVLARVEYEDYLGEATETWSKIWDEFKSA